MRLHAPSRLFHGDLAQIFADGLFAAVNYTREPEASATVELRGVDADGIDYLGGW